jgi:hypothetical protein
MCIETHQLVEILGMLERASILTLAASEELRANGYQSQGQVVWVSHLEVSRATESLGDLLGLEVTTH